MEPAALYLAVVAGTGMAWLAGDAIWAAVRWANNNNHMLARLISRAATLALAVIVVSSSFRLPTAQAEVVPAPHRVMASERQPTEAEASALTLVSMVEAAEPSITSYTVRSGDCLWRIARSTFMEDGVTPTGAMIATFWKRIYDRNAHVIGANPRLIFPGQVLEIPER